MTNLDKAIIFATIKHSGSKRKGTDTPYIVHPLESLSIAAGLTSDPDVLAASVLHDVIEDTDTSVEELEQEFGSKTTSLIIFNSENKMDHISAKDSWGIRKEETIKSLETATTEEKIIVLSDKLSNIRSMFRDQLLVEEKLWDRFNQKDKKMHEWYYRSILEKLGGFKDTTAYVELSFLINKVFN
jgi:guanosine-3',5'-bis(diphosphate) 3'-pyrophosphohydrolase